MPESRILKYRAYKVGEQEANQTCHFRIQRVGQQKFEGSTRILAEVPDIVLRSRMHVRTSSRSHAWKLACTDVCLILQAQLQLHLGALGGSEITNALQEYKRAWYRNKFELGGEPGMLILIEETGLNHGENSSMELKDNVDQDSNWPKLILNDSHCWINWSTQAC